MKSNFVIDKIPWLNKVPVLSLSLSVSVSLCLSLCLFVCVCVCVCVCVYVSLVPRHPPLSGRSVPGYSALHFQDGVRQDTGNRADQTTRRLDWGRGYVCICVCLSHTRALVHTHIHSHARTHTHTYTHTHTHTHTHTVPSLTNRATFCRR